MPVVCWRGPRPEPVLQKEVPPKRTKEKNAAMREARLEGQGLESLAVALQKDSEKRRLRGRR